MKNSGIGMTIMKASKYVYIAGMVIASLGVIAEVFTFMKNGLLYDDFPFLSFVIIVIKYLLIVFGFWIFSLVLAGFGRMVEDNHKKAQAAEELNAILLMKKDDFFIPDEEKDE